MCYSSYMSTPAGAVTPYTQSAGAPALSGRVVNPRASVMHEFLGLIKKVVAALPAAFPEEGAILEAWRIIDSFSRVHLGSEHASSIREHDPAPVEDVRLRRAPNSTGPVMPTAPIDYAALAQAIVEYQRVTSGQAAPPISDGVVHTITDAQPSNGPNAVDAAANQPGYQEPGF